MILLGFYLKGLYIYVNPALLILLSHGALSTINIGFPIQ
jgi:hypothetical protein